MSIPAGRSSEQKVVLPVRIDEGTDIEAFIGPVTGESLALECSQVARINSAGIRGWVRFFNELRARSVRLSFAGCTPAICQQMGEMQNFIQGSELESVYVPFICEDCSRDCMKLYRAGELASIRQSVPDWKCPKCGGRAVFDDLPSQFFRFLD